MVQTINSSSTKITYTPPVAQPPMYIPSASLKGILPETPKQVASPKKIDLKEAGAKTAVDIWYMGLFASVMGLIAWTGWSVAGKFLKKA